MDPKKLAEGMASVIVHHSLARLNLGPHDFVAVEQRGEGDMSLLMSALMAEIMRKGATMIPLPGFLGQRQTYFTHAGPAEHLLAATPIQRMLYGGDVRARIAVVSDNDPTWLTDLAVSQRDLAADIRRKQSIQAHGTHPWMELMQQMNNTGQFGWLVTMWPQAGMARLAGMTLEELYQYTWDAFLLNDSDSLAAWSEMAERNDDLVSFLSGQKTFHVTGPGTDLTIVMQHGRRWIACSGDRNMPDGEVFTSPGDNINGTVTIPLAVHNGQVMRNIVLTWKKGVVVEARAEIGNDTLQAILKTDKGARGCGEFAFGTHPGITRVIGNTLTDEKLGGFAHLALGNEYSDAGGNSSESAVHVDLVFPYYKVESGMHTITWKDGVVVWEKTGHLTN